MANNYMMIDGKRIDISDETAKNLKEQFNSEPQLNKYRVYVAKYGSSYGNYNRLFFCPTENLVNSLKNHIGQFIAIDSMGNYANFSDSKGTGFLKSTCYFDIKPLKELS